MIFLHTVTAKPRKHCAIKTLTAAAPQALLPLIHLRHPSCRHLLVLRCLPYQSLRFTSFINAVTIIGLFNENAGHLAAVTFVKECLKSKRNSTSKQDRSPSLINMTHLPVKEGKYSVDATSASYLQKCSILKADKPLKQVFSRLKRHLLWCHSLLIRRFIAIC